MAQKHCVDIGDYGISILFEAQKVADVDQVEVGVGLNFWVLSAVLVLGRDLGLFFAGGGSRFFTLFNHRFFGNGQLWLLPLGILGFFPVSGFLAILLGGLLLFLLLLLLLFDVVLSHCLVFDDILELLQLCVLVDLLLFIEQLLQFVFILLFDHFVLFELRSRDFSLLVHEDGEPVLQVVLSLSVVSGAVGKVKDAASVS